ncbi:UNVERIFIED_CONTAM: Callose synthase 12 [Sesamum latifolium]|uniref:1,3-beta-glucan synthase n=1 Tax=Sesamum latifolium TaxID=2727402 RepID=A0AAW2TPH9_9LAMI
MYNNGSTGKTPPPHIALPLFRRSSPRCPFLRRREDLKSSGETTSLPKSSDLCGCDDESTPPRPQDEDVYNIIPIHNLLADHPSLRFPEVRAAAAALRAVGDLRRPPFSTWKPHYDLLDWLALFFGFQESNVRNQREHLVLHLANAQMRLSPPPDNIDTLDPSVLRRFRRHLLKNYSNWCSYLNIRSNIWLSDSRSRHSSSDHRRELLYVSLYLLIWGESANLRFVPECICYIFHNMAMELNKILEDYIDENTGSPFVPSISGENAFLDKIVKPIYDTIKAEVDNSKNGTAPHAAWRNYDDINEYFWSKRCFEKMKWPIDVGSNFFVTGHKGKKVGKTGFVEQRSFWNLFRSFDKLWIMLILFLQAAIIVGWEGPEAPWKALRSRDVQVRCLTVFFTWAGLRFFQSLLDIAMQYSLVSRETKSLAVRMVLKAVVAAGWILVFGVFYSRIWKQRNSDRGWSNAANNRVVNFLQVVVAFLAPELLALALFVLPWIRNFVENRNWKIKPMIAPTKTLLDLENVNYHWYEVFNASNRVAIGLLWLPVVLIYLMDIQIWYSIYSSFVGAAVGLLDHLGEIRNMQQLRLRFQFFASAIQFNLMPEEQLLNARGTFKSKFKDAIHRLKLRYGLGRPFKKLESNQVEAYKFALIWNEIIKTFREEDIISDREVELLELPQNDRKDSRSNWEIRVIQWPCLLLCNELLLALSQAQELVDAPDRWLWYKICKAEYRRCSVIEAYDSLKHFLLAIVKYDSEERSIIRTFFQEIEQWVQLEKFTKNYNTRALPKIHAKLVDLLSLVLKPDKDADKVVNALQALYEVAIRDFLKEKRNNDQLKEDGLAPQSTASGEVLLFQNAVQLPSASNETFYRRVRRLHTILTSRDSMQKVPENLEARRRIAFFSNSLFMNMPHAPQVEKMMAFSVLTPYYSEEVLYSKEQLRTENEDGISTLYYLQTIYASDWRNFLERMRREGMTSEKELWSTRLRDLRSWASYRGQTLSRTVRGMMYYYRALEMLAFLDSASEMDMREGSQQLGSLTHDDDMDDLSSERSPSSRTLSRADSSVSVYFKGHERGTTLMKFTYVVACQIYGSQKAKKDPHAEEILYLMKNNEALRKLQREVEIYRVKLPGPLKLGEGKPENQNHAIIFTRGDAVQTIDMNQDNYFEEALKMRNLLEEFKRYYGIRKPTILGVREHIFTGSVSSLAWFMSAQETSFVTLGQRVLANPLKVRMHYGHPDVFDRFWFMTRGGLSKASRVINISEDIFAGFNCTLRGGNVTHHEYIQVGKGRDVGLNQISMFEAKVASGNGAALADANNNRALGTILNQQLIIQLGLFTALPMIVENSLEHGFLNAIWDFITMQLQLSSVFYAFSMGDRGHYFGRTILHGGAKYRATGRGFVVQHKSFAENYRLYARSHFVKAIELGLILTVYAAYSPVAKGTWGGVFAKSEQSWEKWWYEEQDHLRTTGFWGKILEIILDLRFFFFQYGIVYQLGIAAGNKSIVVYLLSWIYVVVALGLYTVIAYARDKYAAKDHIYYRLVQFLVIILATVVIVALLEFTQFRFMDLFTSLLAFIPTGWGCISIAQVLRPILQKTMLWETVVSVARLYDIMFGVIVMAPLALLSWLPGFQNMQTKILFNEAFSRGLHISQIVVGKKPKAAT